MEIGRKDASITKLVPRPSRRTIWSRSIPEFRQRPTVSTELGQLRPATIPGKMTSALERCVIVTGKLRVGFDWMTGAWKSE